MMEIHLGEIRVCEICGNQYEVNEVTLDEPFLMCESCYAEYLDLFENG